MGMPIPAYYTAELVRGLPDDGNKYEVVHGELLVTPAPRRLHQRIVGRLTHQLVDYLAREPVGEAYPGGEYQPSEDALVIPDLLVSDLDSARSPGWETGRPPLLAIEVLSPSSLRPDRFTKRRLYQEVGVPLYWLVDPDARQVEIWTPEALFPITEHDEIRWHPAGAREPLVILLAELFAPV